MILSEMLALLEHYIDDVVDNSMAIRIINAGKNHMATAHKAIFPDVVESGEMDDTFVFPAKYHELPVLYAAAMYKSYDSSIVEKNSYMTQFLDGVSDFTENYQVPTQYRDESFIQHFIAAQGQTEFTVTAESYNHYSRVRVYINSVYQSDNYQLLDGNRIVLYNGANEGDTVSVVWDENVSFESPPFTWWGGW